MKQLLTATLCLLFWCSPDTHAQIPSTDIFLAPLKTDGERRPIVSKILVVIRVYLQKLFVLYGEYEHSNLFIMGYPPTIEYCEELCASSIHLRHEKTCSFGDFKKTVRCTPASSSGRRDGSSTRNVCPSTGSITKTTLFTFFRLFPKTFSRSNKNARPENLRGT